MKLEETTQQHLKQLEALSGDLWTALYAFADADNEGLQINGDDWRAGAIDMATAIDKRVAELRQKQSLSLAPENVKIAAPQLDALRRMRDWIDAGHPYMETSRYNDGAFVHFNTAKVLKRIGLIHTWIRGHQEVCTITDAGRAILNLAQ